MKIETAKAALERCLNDGGVNFDDWTPIGVFDLRAFDAAYVTAATKDVRYFLEGVCLDPRGCLVSTDGHRLTAIGPDACWGVEDGQVGRGDENILQLKKRFTVQQRKAAVDGVGVLLQDEHRAAKVWLAPDVAADGLVINGKFPDWRRVVPTHALTGEGDTSNGMVNPIYLGAIGEIAKRLYHGVKGTVCSHYYGGADGGCSQAFRICPPTDSPAVYHAVGVIMPVRGDMANVMPGKEVLGYTDDEIANRNPEGHRVAGTKSKAEAKADAEAFARLNEAACSQPMTALQPDAKPMKSPVGPAPSPAPAKPAVEFVNGKWRMAA